VTTNSTTSCSIQSRKNTPPTQFYTRINKKCCRTKNGWKRHTDFCCPPKTFYTRVNKFCCPTKIICCHPNEKCCHPKTFYTRTNKFCCQPKNVCCHPNEKCCHTKTFYTRTTKFCCHPNRKIPATKVSYLPKEFRITIVNSFEPKKFARKQLVP